MQHKAIILLVALHGVRFLCTGVQAPDPLRTLPHVYSYAAPADATACNEQVWEAHKHLNEGIASGEVQPLPWTVYSRDKAQDAFRFLAGGACSVAFYFEQPLLRIVGP